LVVPIALSAGFFYPTIPSVSELFVEPVFSGIIYITTTTATTTATATTTTNNSNNN
jgi:hypothetical protein